MPFCRKESLCVDFSYSAISLKIISNFANFVLNQINYSGFFTNK